MSQEDKRRIDNQKKQQDCLKSLVMATQELGLQVETERLNRIAEMIILAMTGPWRYFHTPDHIFEVGQDGDAIEVLSALFHDLVYVQVDQGISINLSYYISPFIKQISAQQLIIRERDELPEDPMFDLVAHIFGFVPGQTLMMTAGQNEFLSALIAAQCLQPILSVSHVAQIAICIEATIPFRHKQSSGLTAAEALYLRVQEVNTRFELEWTEAEMLYFVRRAVRLANRDVENFAFEATDAFLDNTWNLIPETNHDLMNSNSYTVQGYRISIQKMEGFMNFLKPELVFQQFQDEPSDAVYADLIARTAKNLEIAKLYLGTKLLTIAILEALSLWIGDKIPLSIVMGELPAEKDDNGQPNTKVATSQLENHLPAVENHYRPEPGVETEVFYLLEIGRRQDSAYDIKNSPVSTFIVKLIGFDKVRSLLGPAKAFFKEIESARDMQARKQAAETFLSKCDPVIIESISDGVIELFESRKEHLRRAKREILISP